MSSGASGALALRAPPGAKRRRARREAPAENTLVITKAFAEGRPAYPSRLGWCVAVM